MPALITTTVAVNATETLTAEQARDLTERIKAGTKELFRLFVEAHRQQAWRPLGYSSFAKYVFAELGYSKAHAYRLLDHARLVEAVEEAVGSPVGDWNEHTSRSIKEHLPELQRELQERRARGEAAADAVPAAIEAVRRRNVPRQPGSNRVLTNLVGQATTLLDGVSDLIDFAAVEPASASDHAEALRLAGRALIDFADRLEREVLGRG